MLYVTTRIQRDAFTAHKVLWNNRGPAGGFFLPMRAPRYSKEQLLELSQKSFGECVANVINLLFNTKLSGWDIEFSIGRYPVKLVSIGSRATVAETWHNPDWQFDRLVSSLEKLLVREKSTSAQPSDWLKTAARIAVLFGIYSELLHSGDVSFDVPLDIAVPSGDFSMPMAIWYARSWGLPIGNIIVCCNENSAPWNLLHQGELRTDAAARDTNTPKCDMAVPTGLERLIFAQLGWHETTRFVEACHKGANYSLNEVNLKKLRQGMYVCVISGRRLESMISHIYQSSGLITDPYTALCYSGLIDYRSRAGEGRQALILAEESPAFSLDLVSNCLGISPRQLKERINKA